MATTTPRKRKAGEMITENVVRTPRTRGKGAPAPNPPLVPFPTPPSSRHRHLKAALSSSHPEFFALSSTSDEVIGKRTQSAIHLPPHLSHLLTLHNAFNLALSLHIATHPPILPSHPPSQTKLDLANLTNFLSIRDTVERTGGKRFGMAELGRLAWIWNWDGKALPEERVQSARKGIDEDENPFLDGPTGKSTSAIRVCGMSYLITPTRTLDPAGKRVYTHGLGIELDLKPGETRQMLVDGTGGGSENRGQGGGMGAIGRWNAGQEAREDLFRQRLERWVELNGGYEPPEPSLLPTPSTSGSARSTIPSIPILPLPHLGPASSGNLFSSPFKNDSGPGLTSVPKSKALDDPFVIDDQAKDKGKIVRTGSVEERRQAMMDRIKARSGKGPSLGSSVGGANLDKIRPKQAVLDHQEALKRRSTLSRLEGIAETVWMMFSSASPGPNSLPSAPTGRRKIIPLDEVADLVVKSSKTPISTAEAVTSLKMLTQMCPFFLVHKTVARKEWLEMPSAVASTPASPGTATASSRLMSALEGSPRSGPVTPTRSALGGLGQSPLKPPMFEEPASPTPGSRKLDAGFRPGPSASPSKPSRGASASVSDDIPFTPKRQVSADFAGPASPGRVRRVYGLREVRERIRRELGE